MSILGDRLLFRNCLNLKLLFGIFTQGYSMLNCEVFGIMTTVFDCMLQGTFALVFISLKSTLKRDLLSEIELFVTMQQKQQPISLTGQQGGSKHKRSEKISYLNLILAPIITCLTTELSEAKSSHCQLSCGSCLEMQWCIRT